MSTEEAWKLLDSENADSSIYSADKLTFLASAFQYRPPRVKDPFSAKPESGKDDDCRKKLTVSFISSANVIFSFS